MKMISKILVATIIFFSFIGCKKSCDLSLRLGEIVEIPIQFSGFSLTEIDNIQVYRIHNSDTSAIDTFLLKDILWGNMARSTNEVITDRVSGKSQGHFGHYDSYFDSCDLIMDWHSGRDTLSDFEVRKSQEKIEGCHENDPNVRIDKMTFVHGGKIVSKNELIQIKK